MTTMMTLSSRPSLCRAQNVAARAAARPVWLPGIQAPDYLDRTLPADYGFDPLGLAANPEALKWNVQAELVHCRWSMAAVAGILIPSAIIPGFTPWYDAGKEAIKGSPFPFSVLFGIQLILMGFVEGKRWMDIRNPGSQGEPGAFLNLPVEGMLKGTDQVGYPGGPFNPMGMGKDNMKEMQTKEIANGRLAMLAFAGFVAQYVATGKGPLQNLADHLADPWGNNFTTNGVSLPYNFNLNLVNIPATK